MNNYSAFKVFSFEILDGLNIICKYTNSFQLEDICLDRRMYTDSVTAKIILIANTINPSSQSYIFFSPISLSFYFPLLHLKLNYHGELKKKKLVLIPKAKLII